MNYIEWKNTFKKYLYLLPIKEEKETLAYFDEQYNKFMNDKDFQGKFDYILYNNYDSESEKQILDLVKNLIVNE